jgi:hypothetical protein
MSKPTSNGPRTMASAPRTTSKGLRGRPPKYSPAMLQRICEGIRLGLSYQRAAEGAGIHAATLRDWIQHDEQGDLRFAGVASAIATARAEGEQQLLVTIKTAAADDWRAAAWILERRHPEHYARMERREVSGPDGGPLRVEVSSWVDLVRQATQAEAMPAPTEVVPATHPDPAPRKAPRRKG